MFHNLLVFLDCLVDQKDYVVYYSDSKYESQGFYGDIDMKEKNDATQSFNVRLKQVREMRQLTQEKLAECAGMPPSSIAHFEIGSRKPSFDTLRRLADALEITMDFLSGRVDDPSLTQDGDPLFRHLSKLTAEDRDVAKGFLKMLATRDKRKREEKKKKKNV